MGRGGRCRGSHEVRLRLLGGLTRHARAAGGQGRQRGRDDPRARRRPRPGRLHHHHRGVRRLHGRRPLRARGARRAGGRGAGRARGAGRPEARRRRGPAAGLGAVGRARVDAGDARHRPQPRPQRPLGAGPGQGHRQRPLRLGLLPPLRADVRQRRARHRGRALRGRDRARQARPRGGGGHRPRRRRAARARRRVLGLLRVPVRPARAAPAGHPGRLRLVAGRPRGQVPPAEPHPRRLGHGGQRAAHGVRQQGRHQRLRRRVLARRGHRRARALGRLPAQRAGRGRRLRRAHAARHQRDSGVDARGQRAAARDPAHARAPLRRHAGHRVHRARGPALHAPDPQRQAPGAGGGAVRVRRGLRGPVVPRAGAADHRRGQPGDAGLGALRPGGEVRRGRDGHPRLARRRQGRGGVHRRRRVIGQGRGARRHPRALVHGRRRRGRLRGGQGHPHHHRRQGLARGAGRTRDGPPRRHRRGEGAHRRPGPQAEAPRRAGAGRGRLHRHQRLHRRDHHRRRARDRARRLVRARDGFGLGRRAAPARRTGQRRRRGVGRPRRRARRRGHRPVPQRAHVPRRPHPPDGRRDPGRRRRGARRGDRAPLSPAGGRLRRASWRRWTVARCACACSTRP